MNHFCDFYAFFCVNIPHRNTRRRSSNAFKLSLTCIQETNDRIYDVNQIILWSNLYVFFLFLVPQEPIQPILRDKRKNTILCWRREEKNDPHHASFLSFFLFFFFPFCSTKIHLMSCFSLCAHMNCATNEIFWFFRLLFFSSSLLLCLLSFASSIVFFFSFEINWYMTMYGSVTNTI